MVFLILIDFSPCFQTFFIACLNFRLFFLFSCKVSGDKIGGIWRSLGRWSNKTVRRCSLNKDCHRALMKAAGGQKNVGFIAFYHFNLWTGLFHKAFFIIRGRAPWLGPHFLNFFSVNNTARNGRFLQMLEKSDSVIHSFRRNYGRFQRWLTWLVQVSVGR